MRRPGLEVNQGMKEIFGLHSPSGLVEHELIMDTVTFPTRELSEVSHRMELNLSLGSWEIHSQSKNKTKPKPKPKPIIKNVAKRKYFK